MKPILEVINVSKKFKIGHQRASYLSLRDKIHGIFSSDKRVMEDFWALKEISIEVQPGESIGIIGRNGAGKSTLLKILSKITPPTKGKIISRGRIASLLEVGTGFHPELTGRENIFFNGSLLGMKRKEIGSKFDEIVDFSSTEKFLDTPLKHYSNGMQLRLAFSVAAFLEQEILIIDEVLAVGDSIFQQKCIQKMSEINREGRTLLFVSHNLSLIRAICKSAFVLERGQKTFEGNTETAVEIYSNSEVLKGKSIDLSGIDRQKYQHDLVFKSLTFESDTIQFGQRIVFSILLKSNVHRIFSELDFGINFYDRHSSCIIHLSNRFLNMLIDHDDDDTRYRFEVENNLKPGIYNITLFLRSGDIIQDYLFNVIQFEIFGENPYGFHDTSEIQGNTLPVYSFESIRGRS
jgi:lipopolysaccharide transport system ATP-binding protein